MTTLRRASGTGWAVLASTSLIAGLGLGASCSATQDTSQNGGASTTSSVPAGGAGGASSSSSSGASSSSTSSSSSSSTSSSSSGGGGSGGGFVQPPGTADYPAEHEQNNLKTTANPLAAGTKGFTAALHPIGDIDVFSFEVTSAGSTAAVATSDGQGACPAGAHTRVRVVDAAGKLLALEPGLGCAALGPGNSTGLTSMPVGTYWVEVESADASVLPAYVTDIHVTAIGCGDGVVQLASGEQCDDGNTASGDGCSATCQLEKGTWTTETEPNDTQATGSLVDGFSGALASINPVKDVDWFTFNVSVPGSSVIAEVGDGLGGCPLGLDSQLFLFSPAGTQLASDDNGGVGTCSKISPQTFAAAGGLPVGLYAVKVHHFFDNATVGAYVLKLQVKPPGCGDLVVEPGEQCDDGNTTSGDGCSATCQLEGNYTPETEPNDTIATATPIAAGALGAVASISPAGDVDHFSFDVPSNGSSVVITTGDGLGGCPVGFDSTLTLYNPAHAQIAFNDNGPIVPCSQISQTGLSAGTHFVKVKHFSATATQPAYVVTVKVN